MKNLTYIALGYLALALGVIGAFLPILPTTPFVLLAAYFFSKGSPKLYHWLINLPRFGPSIKEWNESGAISLKAKIICVISLTLVIGYLVFYRQYAIYLKVIITSVLGTVMIFVCTRPGQVESSKYDNKNFIL
ncbi:MAG: YbaN family protein [Halobacteriovoraceae bacterium]|nr:YbaN family protein [Halobacteriovoraceae bacterium]